MERGKITLDIDQVTQVSNLKVPSWWLGTYRSNCYSFLQKMCGFTEPVALTPTEQIRCAEGKVERGMRGVET